MRHALVKYLSKGKATSWNEFRAYLMLNVLGNIHLICCLNWIPSTNNMMDTIDRCKLVYMLEQRFPFNFGKLIYDQLEKAALMHESKV